MKGYFTIKMVFWWMGDYAKMTHKHRWQFIGRDNTLVSHVLYEWLRDKHCCELPNLSAITNRKVLIGWQVARRNNVMKNRSLACNFEEKCICVTQPYSGFHKVTITQMNGVPHDYLIKWEDFPLYWLFVWGIPWWPVTRRFDVLFDLSLNKRLSKQSWDW